MINHLNTVTENILQYNFHTLNNFSLFKWFKLKSRFKNQRSKITEKNYFNFCKKTKDRKQFLFI
ncbi:hypothetical protein BpHYR1_008938 [Brachionus plicatilis]|uniref:Uncharacterized protein n=1 Tax=Brachionus plicatilis TaxID=10195 RepID=A0A3M7RKL6_BRAPC|nr:hypothetical protein BpHYR1_008938 [Brachionus plicatilis]